MSVREQKVYFDELAELFGIYAEDIDPVYRNWIEPNIPASGKRAVDLGCGSGRFVDLLAKRYDGVLGVDIAEREIEMARAKHRQPHVVFETRSLLDVTAERDGLFDLVFSVNTIYHLQDHENVLPHVKSLVAPGGHVVVVDIVDPGQWRSIDWHVSQAFAYAEESYRNRSRDHNVAADVLRLFLHPTWLQHMKDNIPLTRPEFRRHYSTAFPGAEFTDDIYSVVAAMKWQAPE